MPIETEELIGCIRKALADKKAVEPIVLDVRGISSVTDFFVIASGTSSPHLKAIGEGVEIPLKRAGEAVYRRSGVPESGWIVLDYVNVVVHILSPEARDYYSLEKLWGDATVVA